ncbi:MAG: DUF1684 domain-containing protein [Bacteroidota bacterium]
MKYPVLIFIIVMIAACARTEDQPRQESSVESAAGFDSSRILMMRAEKDKFFGTSPQSPIPDSMRGEFEGLNYYPPAAEFFVRADVIRFDNPDTVEILTTKDDDIRKMLKFARLEFSIKGSKLSLIAYKSPRAPEHLFVPFTDRTSGRGTYAGGRYIDVEYAEDAETVALDFNLAYSPYCACNPRYSCPLVPEENSLDAAIEAGEKYFKMETINSEKY